MGTTQNIQNSINMGKKKAVQISKLIQSMGTTKNVQNYTSMGKTKTNSKLIHVF